MKKVMFALLALILLMQGCGLFSGYGERLTFGAGEIFYKDGVTKEDAEKLGNYLLKEHFFDEENPKSIQVVKKDGGYTFRMVVNSEAAQDKSFERLMQFVSMDISADVFNQEKVNVELTDEGFDTLKEIPSDGERRMHNGASVYRMFSADAATCDKVTDYLLDVGFISDKKITICYSVEGDDFVFELVTEKGAEFNTEMVNANKIFAGLISVKILNNKPIRLNFLAGDYSIKTSYSFEKVHAAYTDFVAKDSLMLN